MKIIITENLQKTQRYIPHTLETRLAAVKTYRNKNSISFICRRYKVSKASLMRWNKKYDGTKESLMDKSHRPHSQHPNAHTSEELAWIKNLIKRNPNISMIELYAKLKFNKGYNRHPRTPRHNGKVERSHRNDNERFYKYLSFYSYDDLIIQMKKYLYRSNRLPMQTLG